MKSNKPLITALTLVLIAALAAGAFLGTPLYVAWLESQTEFPFFVSYFEPVTYVGVILLMFLAGYKLHTFLQNKKTPHDTALSLILVLLVCGISVTSLYASYTNAIVECRELHGLVHHKSYGMRPFIIQCLDSEGKNMLNVWYQKQ